MTDSESYQYVDILREGRLMIVTINRPEAHNALNALANRELASAFDAFAADPELWVAIITGAGEKAFCAGYDLKEAAAGGGLNLPPSGFGGLTSRFDLTKPVIAAVNGVAMGGGFEIALASDIVVASDAAVFALPEPRVGLAALAGGIQRLPRAIGVQRAMGLILTGRRVTAREGESMGFVSEVVQPQDLLPAARRWADEILKCSPMATRATKEAFNRGLELPLSVSLSTQQRFPAMKAMLGSADAVEGPSAFIEGRDPQWLGR